MVASRPLYLYTMAATLPILILTFVLLFMRLSNNTLFALSTVAAILASVAFGRLLMELTYDIAGYPDFKLPIWAVFYLVVYLVTAFAFVFFGLHLTSPGQHFGGFSTTHKGAFLDSLYISLSDYIGVPPDSSIKLRHPVVRFLPVLQGILSLFVNVVIITKFVSSF